MDLEEKGREKMLFFKRRGIFFDFPDSREAVAPQLIRGRTHGFSYMNYGLLPT
jgi:hypothetical protein